MADYGYIRVKGRGIVPVEKRPCIICGKLFAPPHRLRRYCSLSCENKIKYAIQLTTARKLQQVANAVKMEKGCLDCGYRLHPSALQFDHIPDRGKKLKAVSKFTDAKKMRAEMLKCEVRCANCHFIKTMERRLMKRALTPEQEYDIHAIVRRLVLAGTLNLET